MASTFNISRNYLMHDASLIQFADSLCNTAERDATALSAYGVTAATIATIRAAQVAFADYPSDNMLLGDNMTNTDEIEQLHLQLTTQLRQISTRAQMAYGPKSSSYRLFYLGKLSTLSSEALLRAAQHIGIVATERMAELAPEGLTPSHITDMNATSSALNAALNSKYSLAALRSSATVRRTELGNELYALLVNLSEKGKLCWGDVNATYYSQYLLYR